MGEYDLHCHTTCSDGKADLKEVVAMAEKSKLRGLAITDHDTLEASKLCKIISSPLEIIPGVELTGKIGGKYNIEVLGLFIDPQNAFLEETCKMNLDGRKIRVGLMVQKVNEAYRIFPKITYEKILARAGGNLNAACLDHIADELLERKIFKTRNEAFARCLDKHSTEKNCYVERESSNFADAVDSILIAGGIVAWAHPAITLRYNNMDENEFVGLMRSYSRKIVAMETHYPYDKVRPHLKEKFLGMERYWDQVATDLNLIKIGGSDFHNNPRASKLGDRTTTRKIVRKLRNIAYNTR